MPHPSPAKRRWTVRYAPGVWPSILVNLWCVSRWKSLSAPRKADTKLSTTPSYSDRRGSRMAKKAYSGVQIRDATVRIDSSTGSSSFSPGPKAIWASYSSSGKSYQNRKEETRQSSLRLYYCATTPKGRKRGRVLRFLWKSREIQQLLWDAI